MELKGDNKRTEVGSIPGDWDVKQLGDLGTIVRGGSPRPAGDRRYFNGEFIPWLTVGSLTNIPTSQLFVTDTVNMLTEEGAKRSRTLEPGTLVIVNSGAKTLGVSKILSLKCCANDGIAALIEQHGGDTRFLCYFLNSQIKHLREFVAAGNDQLNLNTSRIALIAVPFPEQTEQSAIADAISDVDQLLEALGRLLAKKQNLRHAVAQRILFGRMRLRGFSGNWKSKHLGDVVEIRKGELITESNVVPGEIPVVAGGRSPAYFHDRANRFGRTITISGSGANAGYVSFYDAPIFASDCSTISEGDSYSIEFIYFVLKMRQTEIYRAQTGGAQPHIHPDDLRPLSIQIPELSEQVAIATVLSDIDRELELIERRLEKTQRLRQGMTQALLTGRARLLRQREATPKEAAYA